MQYRIVDTHPDGYVSGPNPPGIGNVFAYGDLVVICNLDRNFEVTCFQNDALKALARYEFTAFPPDREKAQHDLDFHSFLPDTHGSLFALNHLGHLRRFAPFAFLDRDECALLQPEEEMAWLGDVERTILVHDRLISSSPSGYKCDDPQQPGWFVSSSVHGREALRYTRHFAGWGHISALMFDGASRLAFAAGTRVGLLELDSKELIWEQHVDFHVKVCAFSGAHLLVSGYRPTDQGEGDFAHLVGGGLARLRLADGETLAAAELTVDLAWGNGATPLVLAPAHGTAPSTAHDTLYGVDRKANLYASDVQTLDLRAVFERPANETETVLGAGHMAVTPERIYCGFNRGGYKLHIYSFT